MNWGIIGTGRMAAAFARAIRRVPGAKVVAVASRSTDRAAEFARRFGLPRSYTNAAQLASDRHVEIVYVATTHDRHEDDALAAIAEGKAVLCEKPIAPDAAAALRIVTAAHARQTFCMEGLWSLCLPVYREAFDRIRAGEIGEIRDVSGSFAIRVPYHCDDRLWDHRRRGGALLDRGVYLVALALALLGDASAVYAAAAPAENGVDASTWFILETARGVRCSFTASLDFFGPNEFSVQGTSGHCQFFAPLPCPPGYLLRRETSSRRIAPSDQGAPPIKYWLQRLPLFRRLRQSLLRGSRWRPSGLEAEIVEVERCLSAGLVESPCVPLRHSLRAAEILDRIAALSRSNRSGAPDSSPEATMIAG